MPKKERCVHSFLPPGSMGWKVMFYSPITTSYEFAAPKLPVQSRFPLRSWSALPTSLAGVLAVAVLDAVISYCKWTKQVRKRKEKKISGYEFDS